jgi:hypothetical protein
MEQTVTIDGTTYTHFPLSEDVFRDYYGNLNNYRLNRNFYYIAPGDIRIPVLLGKYGDGATILRNGNDNIIGELPDDNNDFIYTYIFRDNDDVSRQVWRSNPYIYYTTITGGRKRRKTNRKKSKRRKTKKRKTTRRR